MCAENTMECSKFNSKKIQGFIKILNKKPDIICIQETWLKPTFDFGIKGCVCRGRRRGNGGMTFFESGYSVCTKEEEGEREYSLLADDGAM